MRNIYLGLVFLFAWKIKNIYSPPPGPRSPDLANWSDGNLTPQSPTGLTSNPCDATSFKGRPANLEIACHKQCLTVKAVINTIFTKFPEYMATWYLHRKCGMAPEGKCSTASGSPICWCHTKHASGDQHRYTLSNCRSSVQLVQTFTDGITRTMEAVHMQNLPPDRPPISDAPPPVPRRTRTPRKTRANTGFISSCCGLNNKRAASPNGDGSDSVPNRRPGKEPKTSSCDMISPLSPDPLSSTAATPVLTPVSLSPPERSPRLSDVADDDEDICLYTKVGINGQAVQVVVDTGAATCIIPLKYVKNKVPAKAGEKLYSVGDQYSFEILGRTTIHIIVGDGVTIPVTGDIIDKGTPELILGNNFFVTWAAKIKISEGTMELSVGQSKVVQSIHFLKTPIDIKMMNLHQPDYKYTPLLIPALLNGTATRVCVDTGSGATLANRNMMRTDIQYVNADVTFGGSEAVRWLGTADVKLMIGLNTLEIPVFVPLFIPKFDSLLGNDFIPQHVQLIDYQAKIVSFKFPCRGGFHLVKTQMFILQGE